MAVANKIQVGRGKLSARLQDKVNPILQGELFEATYRETTLKIDDEFITDGVTGTAITTVEVGDVFIGIGDKKITKVGTGDVLHFVNSFTDETQLHQIFANDAQDKTNGAVYTYLPTNVKDTFLTNLYRYVDGVLSSAEEIIRSGDMIIFLGGYPAYKISNSATADTTAFDASKAPNIKEAINNDDYLGAGIDVNYVDGAIYYLDHNKFQFGGKGEFEVGLIEGANNLRDKDPKAEIVHDFSFCGMDRDSLFKNAGKFYQITELTGVPIEYGHIYMKCGDSYERLYKNDLIFIGFNGNFTIVHTGASNSEDVEYKKEVERGNAFAEASLADKDSQIATAKDALDNLFETKADLVNGKIPTSELPETVLGSLQFKGTVGGTDSINTILTLLCDVGDYIVWVGNDSPVDELQRALAEINPNCGFSYNSETTHLIRKGDWLVLDFGSNSDNDEGTGIDKSQPFKISLIDHSEGFTQFSAVDSDTDENVIGTKTAVIKGSSREIDGVAIPEVKVTASEAEGVLEIILNTPNAVVFKPDEFAKGHVLIADSNGRAVSSRIFENYDDLDISAYSTLVVRGGELYYSSELHHYSVILDHETTETFAYLSDVAAIIDGTDQYHSKFVTDENGNKKLVDSNLKDVDHGIQLDGGATIVNSTVKWEGTNSEEPGEIENTSIQKLPTQSGTLLNTSSVIDGGIWV